MEAEKTVPPVENCPHCTFVTKAGKKYMRRHVKECHGETPQTTCDICGEVLSSKRNLTRHKLGRHTPLEQTWLWGWEKRCDLCGFATTRPKRLEEHFRRVHPTRFFTGDHSLCLQCDAAFTSEQNVKRHMPYCKVLRDKKLGKPCTRDEYREHLTKKDGWRKFPAYRSVHGRRCFNEETKEWYYPEN